jgi:hypothetical protein
MADICRFVIKDLVTYFFKQKQISKKTTSVDDGMAFKCVIVKDN